MTSRTYIVPKAATKPAKTKDVIDVAAVLATFPGRPPCRRGRIQNGEVQG